MVILNVLGFELLKIYIFIQCFRQKYTDFFFKKEDSDFICLDDSKCQVHGCCVCYPMDSDQSQQHAVTNAYQNAHACKSLFQNL